jgi:hypothetical protein
MQTFMTSETNFRLNAQLLDGPRLRKQGVECYQILRALTGESNGWKHHPAVKMWHGYEGSLFNYTEQIYIEIDQRGWKADNLNKVYDLADRHGLDIYQRVPVWVHDLRVKNTHRASLYRKDPESYYQWEVYNADVTRRYKCCERCNYFWPTHAGNKDFLW